MVKTKDKATLVQDLEETFVNLHKINLKLNPEKCVFGVWYVHFASCFYIDIYCIMDCYFTLCHNTYGYSLLFYKVYIRRENAGSWNSGLEKEQILETYSAQLQKSWNSTEYLITNNEKSSPKMKTRGATPFPWGWGALPPYGAPYLVGPLMALRWPFSAIWSLSSRKK